MNEGDGPINDTQSIPNRRRRRSRRTRPRRAGFEPFAISQQHIRSDGDEDIQTRAEGGGPIPSPSSAGPQPLYTHGRARRGSRRNMGDRSYRPPTPKLTMHQIMKHRVETAEMGNTEDELDESTPANEMEGLAEYAAHLPNGSFFGQDNSTSSSQSELTSHTSSRNFADHHGADHQDQEKINQTSMYDTSVATASNIPEEFANWTRNDLVHEILRLRKSVYDLHAHLDAAEAESNAVRQATQLSPPTRMRKSGKSRHNSRRHSRSQTSRKRRLTNDS